MAKSAKKITFTTPLSVFVWPKLNTPDQYVSKKGKKAAPKYVWQGSPVNPEDLKKLRANLEAIAKKLLPDCEDPKLPLKTAKVGKDEDAEEVTFLIAKSGVKFKPSVFDAKNKRIPDDVIIGGGTTGKASVTVDVLPDDDGLHLYLNAVQVTDLKEGTFGKSPFDEGEGFEYSGEGRASSDESSEDASEGDEGDAPFAF